MTYRYHGHSMGDPERYRKHDEVVKWEEEDPIGIFRRYLVENKIATDAELDEQDRLAEETIRQGVEFAESSPEPAVETLFKNIYYEG